MDYTSNAPICRDHINYKGEDNRWIHVIWSQLQNNFPVSRGQVLLHPISAVSGSRDGTFMPALIFPTEARILIVKIGQFIYVLSSIL